LLILTRKEYFLSLIHKNFYIVMKTVKYNYQGKMS